MIKDGCKYIEYKIKIDNSISDTLSEKFNVQKLPNEFVVSGINIENTKIEEFLNDSIWDENYTITFYKDNKMLSYDNIITTGTIMRVYNKEKEFYQDYSMILYGDVNGDGEINSFDALIVVNNKINGEKLYKNEINIEAGRTSEKTRNEKTIPSAVDALTIVKYKLGLDYIKQ